MKILTNGYKKILEGKPTDTGSEAFMASLIPYIQERKHTLVSLVLRGNDGPDVKDTTSRQSTEHGDYILFNTYFGVRKVRESKSNKLPDPILLAVKKVEAIIRVENPDLVLVNGFNWSNWILLKAAANLNIPVTTIQHGLWFNEISEKMTAQGRKLTFSMQKDIHKYSEKLFFVSQFSLEQFEKYVIKVKSSKLYLIPLPYNPIYESKPKPQNKGKTINIGLVSRWDPVKNPQAFLETAKKAKELKLPWKFHAVTSFIQSNELAPLVDEFKKHINIINPLRPNKLKAFYQKMDLMLLPSKFDVLGAVVMEAALQKRATLISPTVGWAYEYKKLGLKSLITPFKNPHITIKVIKSQIRKPPSEQFIKHIKATHSPKAIFNDLINALESTV